MHFNAYKIFEVKRYSINKELITSGHLTVRHEGQRTSLNYRDKEINITASELYHPISALDGLRSQLETIYQSMIAINGCRIDVDHRANGGVMCYFIEYGKKAVENIYMFEPTDQVDKLCTVSQHEQAYLNWVESILPAEL